MWTQRVCVRSTVFSSTSSTRIKHFSYRSPPGPQSTQRQPVSKRIESQNDGQPPTLHPSTAVNYHCPLPNMPKVKKRTYNQLPWMANKNPPDENMGPPSVTIPGLTLLNNIAPHPIMATPQGGFINPTIAKPPTRSAPILVKKGKKSKYALRKEAQAQAQAQEEARRVAAQPLNQPSFNHRNTLITNVPKDAPKGPNIAQQDDRQVPSKDSGGVPDPTPLYLAQSFAPPIVLPQPRRILVIMDLNGTLLYRPNKRNPFNFIERPHARRFLSYCIETFHVAIWSSARPENVDKMVAQLLSPDQRAKCVVTWARDKFGLSQADYNSRVQCYKRLTTLWNDPQVIASHPAAVRGERWDQTNTVLVDDSMEKGRSEPHNILQIPEFSGLTNEPRDVLPQVHDYLNSLCYQADISRHMRESPFKLDVNYKLPPPPAE